MTKARKTRKFGAVKRIIGSRDARLKKNQEDESERKKKEASQSTQVVRQIPQAASSLFFQYNTALVPPYSVLVDTNFLSHTVKHKLPLLESMMDVLYAKCIPIITSCTLAELEKLGPRYRIALMIAKDPRWEQISCDHRGTKVPGVPIMSVARGKYVIERLPNAPE
ncbi:hypothetical protein B7463_g3374, partial [Scytalidium lignicola]